MSKILTIIHVIIRPANNVIFLNLAHRLEKLPSPDLKCHCLSCIYVLMERMAEWLRRWTLDRGVRGSIPGAGHSVKALGKL